MDGHPNFYQTHICTGSMAHQMPRQNYNYINRDAGPCPIKVYNPLIYTTPESHYLPSFPYMVDLQLFVLLRWPFIPTPMFLRLFTYICYQNCYTFLHPPVPAFPTPTFTALLSHTFFALSAQSCNLLCLVCVIFNTDEDP